MSLDTGRNGSYWLDTKSEGTGEIQMRFQLTVQPKTGNDIEVIAVVFTSATWSAAATWAKVFMSQLGFDNADYSSVIVYASKTNGDVRNEVKAIPNRLGAPE